VESVEYDPVNHQYLTSSDNTAIVAIAPNGALSYFGTGTEADYGMEVIGNDLYTIVGSSIHSYDLLNATLNWSQPIAGAGFLNGMASNGTDSIWFTDFSNRTILAMNVNEPQNYTTVVTDTDETPNGIVHDGINNRCLFVTWGSNAHIKAMDLTSYNVSYVVQNTGLGNIDGIDSDPDGNWYVSSWSPNRITRYNNDFSSSETITVPGIFHPADICFADETDTLAIPGADQVLFIGFGSSTVGLEQEEFEAYGIYYHSGLPEVRFSLNRVQHAEMHIVTSSGQLAYTVFDGVQSAGKHRVILGSIGLSSGMYLCRMTSSELSFTERVFIP